MGKTRILAVLTTIAVLHIISSLFSIVQGQNVSSCNGTQCIQRQPLATSTVFWMSLPGGNPLVTAEQLFDSIPNATSVKKVFPAAGTCDSYQWDGSTCTVEPAGCLTVPEPGCTTSCFCITPGVGIEVDAPIDQEFNIFGHDDSIVFDVIGGKDYIVSVPLGSPLRRANDLWNLIPGRAAGVDRVLKLNSNGTLDAWLGNIGLNFPIEPGAAYKIEPPLSGQISIGCLGWMPRPCTSSAYDVIGTSSGADYAWGVDCDANGSFEEADNNVTGLPIGSSSAKLAEDFVDQINSGVLLDLNAQLDPTITNGDRFCVNCRIGTPELYADTAPGPAACNINSSGSCTYNPTIELAFPQIPTAAMPQKDLIEWSRVSSEYDLIRGNLTELWLTAGDYNNATKACLEDNTTGTSRSYTNNPPITEAFFFLLRAFNSFDNTGYNTTGLGQVLDRDVAILGSPGACP